MPAAARDAGGGHGADRPRRTRSTVQAAQTSHSAAVPAIQNLSATAGPKRGESAGREHAWREQRVEAHQGEGGGGGVGQEEALSEEDARSGTGQRTYCALSAP